MFQEKYILGQITLSRKEVTAALVNLLANTNKNCWEQSRELDASLEVMVAAAMPHPISWQKLRNAVSKDKVLTMLADQISTGSPAQVIFGRELRDFLPAPIKRYQPQPQWILLQEDREKTLRKCALRYMEKLGHGTKQLGQLQVHDSVQVQNQVGNHPSRWDITGTIVELRPYDQYVVKVHGSGRLIPETESF